MSFGNWPVASFRQRSVYKTEFDIFKQNTDIDLISLLSYEDHTPKCFDQQQADARPRTVPEAKTRPRDCSTSGGITERSGNKKRILSAYDPNNKNTIKTAPEREFRRNIWNKGDTSVYRAFARTSKTFLNQKHKANDQRRELKVNRECSSALDIRKPVIDPGVRSQTTCGFRTNERKLIKAVNTNTFNVPNANKETKLNHQVNKAGRAALNNIWRTKSAPTIGNTNKTGNFKRQQSTVEHKPANINKRRRSGWTENKIEDIHDTKKTYYVNQDLPDKTDTINPNEFSPTDRIDEQEAENGAHNQDIVKRLEDRLQEFENIECVENENITCIVEKEEENYNSGNDKDVCNHSVTTVQEDGICSKDSGFASNAATPELEFWNREELKDDKNKRVKFHIENQKTDASFEHEEQCSAISENGNCDTLNEATTELETNETDTVYDINTLITDLERFGANSRLSVISAGGQSNYTGDGEAESLCGDAAQKALDDLREEEQKEKAKLEEEKKKQSKPKDIESLNMSKEARHAIMETLKDMGTRKGKWRNKENGSPMRHKGVNAQRRQHDNRSKYEYYMRERTKSVFRNHFTSMDSVGNEDNSSAFSSPRDVKDCDDTSSEEYVKGKLFPSIRENSKLSKTTASTKTSTVMTLEHVKKTKYKIPGIGNYNLIASPDNDFEITPPGFDSRYNPRPIISKEEMEIPPRFIRERSIEKCKTWLTNINLSPMSLRPATKRSK